MRRLVTKRALLVGSVLAVSAISANASARGADAIVEGAGAVVKWADGEEKPVTGAAHASSGATVRSAADAFATISVGPTVRLRLAPGSVVSIVGLAWLPAAHPGAKPEAALQVTLQSGALDIDVRDETLGVTMTLPKGTTFAMWRGAGYVAALEDHSAVALFQGTAIAGAAEKWKEVPAGQGAVLVSGQAPVLRPLPAAPSWLSPAPFALVQDASASPVKLKWSGDGASYEVEIGRDAEMTSTRPLPPSKAQEVDTSLAAGTYFTRVRARAADGVVGPASAARAARIVRATLPEGAIVGNGGVVILPVTRKIAFDDVRNLDLATSAGKTMIDAPYFGPAPSEIGLGVDHVRTVRIRDKQSGGEAQLTLARRELRARVTLTPKRAHWPEDPVDVTVVVDDPSGFLDPTKETIHFDARINLDATPLAWSQEGATWHARVAPRVPPGPWVVRVDVHDASGSEIGAGFLEVDGPRLKSHDAVSTRHNL